MPVRRAALLTVAVLIPACNLTFTGDDPQIAPEGNPFVLQIPYDGSTGVLPVRPEFAWSELPGADSYELQISLTSDFTSIVDDETNLTVTSVFSSADLTYWTSYWWRVFGFQGGTPVLAGGSPYRFTTIPPLSPPDTFLLRAPLGSGASTTPIFSWTASPNATSYTLEVDLTSVFLNPVIDVSGLHVTQLASPVTLSADTTYYWQVTAVNLLGAFRTTVGSFTTTP